MNPPAIKVDRLPKSSGIRCDFDGEGRVRFQAFYYAGDESEWSDWYDVTDEPIALTWAAFWEGGCL